MRSANDIVLPGQLFAVLSHFDDAVLRNISYLEIISIINDSMYSPSEQKPMLSLVNNLNNINDIQNNRIERYLCRLQGIAGAPFSPMY